MNNLEPFLGFLGASGLGLRTPGIVLASWMGLISKNL